MAMDCHLLLLPHFLRSHMFLKPRQKKLPIAKSPIALLAIGLLCLGGWDLFAPQAAVSGISGTNIIETALNSAKALNASYDQLWQDVLNGDGYRTVSVAAGEMSGFSALMWLGFNKDNLIDSWADYQGFFYRFFVAPLLTGMLLLAPINNTILLGHLSLQFRNFSNSFSSIAAAATSNAITNPIASTNAQSEAMKIANIGFQRCMKISVEAQRDKCLDEVGKRIQLKINPYLNEPWAEQMRTSVNTTISSLKTDNLVEAFLAGLTSPLTYLSGAVQDTGAAFVLMLANGIILGTTAAIEIIWLMATFCGPLAIALSLIPLFSNLAKVWATLMGSGAVLSFVIKNAITLVSLLTLQSTGGPDILGPATLAVLCIFFSVGIATGSGVSAFQGATNFVGNTILKRNIA
jgi:hypothetical protein